MLVSDLFNNTQPYEENNYRVTLNEVRLAEEGLFLRDKEEFLPFDDIALDNITKYLKVNGSYISKCPAALQRDNINYWFNHYGETEAVFYTVGGNLRGVYSPLKKIFPVQSVLEIATRVFEPHDEIKQLNIADKLVHLDVVSVNTMVEVPGTGTEERPSVGDITHGGLRMLMYPFQEKAPEVESYFNRVWCSNGMSAPEPEHRITLRGNTIDDVLAELEDKARLLMDELPRKLEEYKNTANIAVPGRVGEFVYQIGRENGLSSRIIDKVMNNLALLPEDPSLYDVMQLFTSIANEPMNWNSRLKLQRLGGEFALNTNKIINRCGHCERPI